MTTVDYDTVLREAQHLSPEEQQRLATTLLQNLAAQPLAEKPHSILELRGLGKDLWRRIDSTAYLNQERDAWDG
jgi:hypothetical protein